jgi:hypothetical protein
MSNGYALCTDDGLRAVIDLLNNATGERCDALRGQLAIGLHRNVEVTDVADDPHRYVSQVFCSAAAGQLLPHPAAGVGVVCPSGARGRLRSNPARRRRAGQRRCC